MSDDDAIPESYRRLEYIGERGTWSPDRTISYACEERMRNDRLDKENLWVDAENKRLSDKCAHLEIEMDRIKRKHAKKREVFDQLEKENAELKQKIADMQEHFQDEETHKLKAEIEHFRKCFAEAEQEKEQLSADLQTAQQNFAELNQLNDELEQQYDIIDKENEELREAKDTARRTSRCFHAVSRENADLRSVLREHLEQENQFRRRLHIKQVDVEAIMESTKTAAQHVKDEDIDE